MISTSFNKEEESRELFLSIKDALVYLQADLEIGHIDRAKQRIKYLLKEVYGID